MELTLLHLMHYQQEQIGMTEGFVCNIDTLTRFRNGLTPMTRLSGSLKTQRFLNHLICTKIYWSSLVSVTNNKSFFSTNNISLCLRVQFKIKDIDNYIVHSIYSASKRNETLQNTKYILVLLTLIREMIQQVKLYQVRNRKVTAKSRIGQCVVL